MKTWLLYWLPTGLVAAGYLVGGGVDLWQPEDLVKGVAKLGYPLYFFSILGVWKIAGGLAILAPGLPRIKEWAYAGMVFNLTGAIASHVLAKDALKETAPAAILLALAVASYLHRPADRRLPGPPL